MSTKLQNHKKITKQVRIDTNIHKKLKLLAVEKNTLMTSLLDEIINSYLDSLNIIKKYEQHSK
jgi:hypothetical protein